MELKTKPDFGQAMRRIEAWFAHEMIDRPPVRFAEHNADFSASRSLAGRTWPDLKSRWFDAEYQVDLFSESIRNRKFNGETFPIYWPNLGPNIYAAFYGAELQYGEITSWALPCVHDWNDIKKLKFNADNQYYRKMEEMMKLALQKCGNEFMVGYTDLHGSLDCAAAWRDSQMLCFDIVDSPEKVHELIRLADQNFFKVYDYYDDLLKKAGQMSITWMGIPSRGKMHIPSCDFTSMVSPEDFNEFYFPSLRAELKHMTHNIFHLDGKGMLTHLDVLLEQPEIHAIQWVQGMGVDLPVQQWFPVIRKIQAAGKGVVIDIQLDEIETLISSLKPEGLYICLAAPEKMQNDILKRFEKW